MEHAVPTAQGNGGQRIFILRERNAVVVVTAGIYNAQSLGAGLAPETLLIDRILPATGSGPVGSDFRWWLRAALIGAGIVGLLVLAGGFFGVRAILRRRAARRTPPGLVP